MTTGAPSRWGSAALAVVLLIAAVRVLLFRPTGDPRQVYEPEGYAEQVDEWIDRGLLTYDCDTDTVEVAADLVPAERTFFRHSELPKDVEAWNAGDRRPFFFERQDLRGGACAGRLIGANPDHHKQRLPTYVAKTWEGSLFLRPSSGGTTLTSADRTLEILRPRWRQLPLSSDAYEDADLGTEGGGVRSQRLALRLPPSSRAFATLTAVGDDPVLEVLEEDPSVSVDSCPAPLGWRLRLEGGDVVRARSAGRLDERFAVETGEQAALASALSQVNGEPRRRHFPERLAMAREVTHAVDAVVEAARAEDREREDFDVHLTLDPFLSARLEEVLSRFAQRYGRRLPRVAVTVMQPESGRLLALASYPRAEDLKRYGLDEDSTRLGLLRHNHNFLHHPVGSATKPFLAAAALAAEPRLASLRLPCTLDAVPETLLGYDMGGYDLPGDCSGAGDGGLIDLESFLEVSSNRYMLYLGLLAMADWDGGGPRAVPAAALLPEGERYLLDGRAFRSRPFLPMVRYDEDRPGDGHTPLQEVARQSDLSARFAALFDQGAEYRREEMVSGLDLDLWEPVLRAARSGGEGAGRLAASEPAPRAALAFSKLTSDKVNLRLNLAQQLRQDLYTVLLGNGNNRWNNVQLAEALARLVTGRRVAARLVERIEVPADRTSRGDEAANGASRPAAQVLFALDDALPEEAEPLAGELPDPLRRRLLDGMLRVVASPVGTAQKVGTALDRLNGEAPAGVVYRALAKTGTPTLDLSTVRASPVEPAPGAIVTYSGNPQVKSGVLVLALEREGPAEDGRGRGVERLVLTFFVDSQGGSGEAVELAAALVRPLAEAYWPRDWLEVRRP